MVITEEEPLRTEKITTKRTFKENLTYLKENITVEPVIAFYVILSSQVKLAVQNLNLDKACRVNKEYGAKICDTLIAKTEKTYYREELAVQELIAQIESWTNVLLTIIPSFLIIFLGAWSDRTGKRKIFILLPIVGELLVCLSSILNVYFFYELPVEVTMFLEAFFPAITGGWITMYMGIFAYISDITSEESRTLRFGLINLCLSAGAPIGSVLSGILLNTIGYYGVFSLSSFLYMFSIIYGCLYVKDPERIVTGTKNKTSGRWSFIKYFFNIKHVKDTVKVAFKDGPKKRRIKSILILVGIVFVHGPAYGEGMMKYLFTRYCFNWDALMYSLHNTFYTCTHCVGMMISIIWFSKHLKWDDSLLGIMSCCSRIFASTATALARDTKDMYIAVAIETFNASAYTALRSISSKLCSSDELGFSPAVYCDLLRSWGISFASLSLMSIVSYMLGYYDNLWSGPGIFCKTISLFNLVLMTTSLTFGSLYSLLYFYTVEINAGIIFHVTTVFTIPPLLIFIWFYIQHKKDPYKSKSIAIDDEITHTDLENMTNEDQLVTSIHQNH